MNVLLINSNREITPWPVVPLGLSYVASSLKYQGHNVHFLDLTFTKRPADKITGIIKSFRPDIIGISIRNVDDVNMCDPRFYLTYIKMELVTLCKKYSENPLVIGGSAIGIAAESIMNYLEVDYAVAGDGETPMVQLLEYLVQGKGDLDSIEGLFYRQPDGVIHVPTKYTEKPLKSPFHPKPYSWIDYNRYEKHGGTANIQTKRGCVFNCTYCSYNLIEGTCHRLRDPLDVVDEIEEWIREAAPRSIEFVDSVFNSPIAHSIEICEEIIKRNITIPFTTMGLNPGLLSSELVSVMQKAGFDQCMCSPDSASNTILLALNKNFNKDDLFEAARLFRKYDMKTFWFFIMGAPGETKATVTETLDFCNSYIPPEDVVHFTIGFRVFPQTALQAHMIKEGIIKENDELLRPEFFCNSSIAPEEILSMIHHEARTHVNYITYFDMEIYDFLKSVSNKMLPFISPDHSWVNIPKVNKFLDFFGLWNRLHRRHRRKMKQIAGD